MIAVENTLATAATDLFLRGLAYTEIVRRLNAGPYPAPGGGPWQHGTVWSLLHNDTYAGRPRWGPYHPDGPSVHFPALWDEATYTAVLNERQRRIRRPYVRRGAGPLTGVAYCGRCGGRMTRARTHYKGSTYTFLNCSTHRHRTTTGISCHHNNIPEHRILSEISTFLDWLATPARLDQALDELAANPDHDRIQVELDQVLHTVRDCEQQRQRLVLALAAGQLHADLYRDADDLLLDRLNRARQRASELQQLLDARPDPQARRELLDLLIREFPSLLAHADPAELAALLQQAGIRVEIEANRVTRILLT